MSEFDPTKLRISLTTKGAGYGCDGATRITASLFYDEQKISSDDITIHEGEPKREW